MFRVFLLMLSLTINSGYSNIEYFQHPIDTCRIGDVVKNECNSCLCTSKGIFECKPIHYCNKTRGLEDTDVGVEHICIPNQLYMQNLITCICTKDGQWPHKSCHETFFALPPKNVEVYKCEPNTYAVVDCNVCRCGPNGEFLSNRCTKNSCEDDIFRRFYDETKQSVYSNCIPRNWYSFAPCQFCYCVNENKLICNTGHPESKQLAVGKYNMEICGTDLINEAIELIPAAPLSLRQVINDKLIDKIQMITNKNKPEAPKKSKGFFENLENNSKIEKYSENNEDLHTENTPKNQGYHNVVEDKKKHKPIRTNIVSTIPPPVNVKASDSGESPETDSEDDDTNEVDLNIKTNVAKAIVVKDSAVAQPVKKIILMSKKPTRDVMFTDNTLKVDVPTFVNKVFKLAFRKSLVSLRSETKCLLGSTSTKECNVCFCLKNKKLLCTANKC